jgi:hypothetical protein
MILRARLSCGRMILLLAPLSRPQVVSLSQSSCVSPVDLLTGGGEWGGRGAESYDRERVWPSVNHFILSVLAYSEDLQNTAT